jgi:cytoskeletal protein CcmA (bactofilin family)
MWNKHEDEPTRTESVAGGEGRVVGIGASISIVGDLIGEEDLTVLGRVEGKIQVPKHAVTVGPSGRVSADIAAKVVRVEGEVRGNLNASEQILIRKTATMLGNLTAPRVGLEDGCRFKGSVDMEMPAEKADRSPAPRPPVVSVEPRPAVAVTPTDGRTMRDR